MPSAGFPIPKEIEEPSPPGDVLLFDAFPGLPLTVSTIAQMTIENPVLLLLYSTLQAGRVESLHGDDSFRHYVKHMSQLSMPHGCITWGGRVVIPVAARAQVMALAHAGHSGVVAMKNCARGYFWWPLIDEQIKETGCSCHACQLTH